MLTRKYIFETRKTRTYRVLFNSFVLISALLILIASFCIYLPLHGQEVTRNTEKELFKKVPDLIAVFTGDSGRISYGLELASRYPSTHVLISGVYTNNSLQTIIDKQDINVDYDKNFSESPPLVSLDYQAKNTIENIIYTLRFLRQRKNLQKVLIISHDYHILRIQLLLSSIVREDEAYRFYFHGVESNYREWRSIKKLVKEVFKLVRGIILAASWES